MPILFGALWAITTPVLIVLTIKYWLPLLRGRTNESTASINAEQKPDSGHYVPRTRLFSQTWPRRILLGGSILFAFCCGYKVSMQAASVQGILSVWLAFCVLACVFVTDWEFFLIPNECSVILLVGGLANIIWKWISEGAFPAEYAGKSAISLIICLVSLLAMSFVTKGGIGMGDVKISCSMAFLCGLTSVLYMLTIALLLCAVSSTGLLIMKKKHLKDLLPLGPFLWLAMGCMILLGII